ncbi:hypothetical protein SAMN05443633_101266 [Chryseobacterium arachidis]|uniref:Uncharacterized protein n=1 Tax=Chryseobacterium arachidis TaxID=1416778 RepID=A0A1M4TL65_9FLAO|nr:hypothetical protein SAMN05443633_101266 [Chryseobacterium arachidis]
MKYTTFNLFSIAITIDFTFKKALLMNRSQLFIKYMVKQMVVITLVGLFFKAVFFYASSHYIVD